MFRFDADLQVYLHREPIDSPPTGATTPPRLPALKIGG